MANLKVKGKFEGYDITTGNITIKLDILDPSLQSTIEDLVQNYNNYLHLTVDYNVKDSIRDQLRKKWYASLHNILMYNHIVPSGEKMLELDEDLRKNIFPVKDGDVLMPKRMREMSNTELQDAISTLTERYSECLQ